MTKWADFAISGVRYNDEKTHIIAVERFEDDGDKLINKEIRTRSDVINAIKNKGCTYITTYIKEGKWKKGAEVSIQKVDGIEYIRTDANNVKKDNLGNLPEF